jgi:hypothetical protein
MIRVDASEALACPIVLPTHAERSVVISVAPDRSTSRYRVSPSSITA